jgi:hypothetical protein
MIGCQMARQYLKWNHPRFIAHVSQFRIQYQAIIKHYMVLVTELLDELQTTNFYGEVMRICGCLSFLILLSPHFTTLGKGRLAFAFRRTCSPLSVLATFDKFCEASLSNWVDLHFAFIFRNVTFNCETYGADASCNSFSRKPSTALWSAGCYFLRRLVELMIIFHSSWRSL